jgi:hypothetical protein
LIYVTARVTTPLFRNGVYSYFDNGFWYNDSTLFKNDIVMVMSDVPKGKALAKCYLIEEDNKYSLNQRICAIRSDKVEARFLYFS